MTNGRMPGVNKSRSHLMQGCIRRGWRREPRKGEQVRNGWQQVPLKRRHCRRVNMNRKSIIIISRDLLKPRFHRQSPTRDWPRRSYVSTIEMGYRRDCWVCRGASLFWSINSANRVSYLLILCSRYLFMEKRGAFKFRWSIHGSRTDVLFCS